MNQKTEFQKFDATMKQLIKVPHDRLKAALDAEKAEKKTRRKAKKPSASGRVSSDKD
ncbi:MAG: hypothetical protein WBE44_12715 [Terriglobales bacterium]|jgi:hypothetical protein